MQDTKKIIYYKDKLISKKELLKRGINNYFDIIQLII